MALNSFAGSRSKASSEVINEASSGSLSLKCSRDDDQMGELQKPSFKEVKPSETGRTVY